MPASAKNYHEPAGSKQGACRGDGLISEVEGDHRAANCSAQGIAQIERANVHRRCQGGRASGSLLDLHLQRRDEGKRGDPPRKD